jgi:hypothetical protein
VLFQRMRGKAKKMTRSSKSETRATDPARRAPEKVEAV